MKFYHLKHQLTLVLFLYMQNTFLYAQGETSPRIVLDKAAMYAATNQYQQIRNLILPIDDASAKELDFFIEFLKQQKEIRSFLLLGKEKFKEDFFGALNLNVFLILRMLSPDYYEQAAIDGEIIITGKLAYIDFEYQALDGTNTTYKDKIVFKEKDNLWFLAFSKDMYNAPLDKVLIALKQYLPKAIQAVEESPDSGTLAENLSKLEFIFKS